jgi:hypothetical protein
MADVVVVSSIGLLAVLFARSLLTDCLSDQIHQFIASVVI